MIIPKTNNEYMFWEIKKSLYTSYIPLKTITAHNNTKVLFIISFCGAVMVFKGMFTRRYWLLRTIICYSCPSSSFQKWKSKSAVATYVRGTIRVFGHCSFRRRSSAKRRTPSRPRRLIIGPGPSGRCFWPTPLAFWLRRFLYITTWCKK